MTRKTLVTGAAGFIGFHTVLRLLECGREVIGIDNMNSYYDVKLKEDRLNILLEKPNFIFSRISLENYGEISEIFEKEMFDEVIHLAAQVGVRSPPNDFHNYISSNLIAFSNILDLCRVHKIKHLVYASSSSVYGLNTEQPFSTHKANNHPVSLYAATKKANELIAHTYSHLYKLPTTGLRFFTVYGPYDRPDMALQKFTRAIMNGEPIKVFNYGKHRRDFTYIDDIVEGIVRVLDRPALPNLDWDSNNPDSASSSAPYRIYNIGNNNPVNLMDYIKALEISLGKTSKKELLPLQPGDIPDTYADIDDLVKEFGYKPSMSVQQGVENFVAWYKLYNNI